MDMNGKMQVHIRQANKEDFLAIACLDREAWGQNRHAEFIPDGEHVWRIWCEHALVFCAEREAEIIGAILAFPTMNALHCIHKVFVHQAFRGQGIGSLLFKSLLQEVDRLALSTFLTVDPDNGAALALYEKWGFGERKFVEGYYRSQEHRYVLSRVAGDAVC